jgi:hypothetical protein
MGYSALNIGHTDFAFGDDFITAAQRDYGVPVVSSNLFDNATQNPIAPEKLLYSFGSFTVGIIGIVSHNYQQAIEKFNAAGSLSIEVLDETEALRRNVAALQDQANLIIVLADTGIERARQLAANVQGIHIIVCSGGYDITESPIIKNGVYIVKAGTKGEYIGKLTLRIAENGSVLGAEGSVTTLSEDITESDTVVDIIDSYHKGLKAYADELLVVERKNPDQGWYYTGAFVCAPCHVSQSGNWRTTGHQKAFSTLVDRSQDYNPECIECHITGYGYTGGFDLPTTTPDRGNVQCEMCHGPGGEHAETLAVPYGETSEDTCLACHTEDHSPDFDYEVYYDRIKH